MLELAQLVDYVDVVDGAELLGVPGPGFGEVGDVDGVCPGGGGVVLVDDEEVLGELDAGDVDGAVTVSFLLGVLLGMMSTYLRYWHD